MPRTRVGVQLAPQHTTYEEYADAVRRAEEIGVDVIWNWDHFFPLSGDPQGNHFEAWTLLTAMATLTSRAEIGCLVSCNSYRNPNLLADMARTVDHISGGRLIFGIGAGWFERDYDEYGYEFGTGPSRLKDLARNLPIIQERWRMLIPSPVRNPIPIMIGGSGKKVTLRLTAQYADLWNGGGTAESFRHKNQVLDDWCAKVNRDPAAIERTCSVNASDLDHLDDYVATGAQQLILRWGAPWNTDSLRQLVAWRDSQD